MDREASSSDPSDEELVSRHVFALEQRVSHLEHIIHHSSERGWASLRNRSALLNPISVPLPVLLRRPVARRLWGDLKSIN